MGVSVHMVWCAPAGLQGVPVKPQGQGVCTAEVCCRQAGLVTVLVKLNDRVTGRPETLQIKASTACKLQVTKKDPICCTAGLAPMLLVHVCCILRFFSASCGFWRGKTWFVSRRNARCCHTSKYMSRSMLPALLQVCCNTCCFSNHRSRYQWVSQEVIVHENTPALKVELMCYKSAQYRLAWRQLTSILHVHSKNQVALTSLYLLQKVASAPLNCLHTRELRHTLTAGSRAKVSLCCLDAFGNQLEVGGAQLEGHFIIKGAAVPCHAMPHPCEAADDGRGLYALSFTPETAGTLEVSRLVLHSRRGP